MITYSTNFMGPISMDWFRQRGLTKKVTRVIEADDFLADTGIHKVGDVLEYEEVTTYYAGGRIDIRGMPEDEYYCGWHEYSLPSMHGEDFNEFSDWLEGFQTRELWEFEDLISCFESVSGRKIRWAEDTWYYCPECGMITDLRSRSVHLHKMDCTRSWDKE